MLELALSAAEIFLNPTRLSFVALGVLIGLSLGVIPGLGGVVGLSLLLPFTFDMDPLTALAFLVGLQAVVVTSDTIPAVLFGVPGTVGSAATILDGHPKRAAYLLHKVLKSAIANASQDLDVDLNALVVSESRVDEGPLLGGRVRWRPRAQGRATPIHKRTSHLRIGLSEATELRKRRGTTASTTAPTTGPTTGSVADTNEETPVEASE